MDFLCVLLHQAQRRVCTDPWVHGATADGHYAQLPTHSGAGGSTILYLLCTIRNPQVRRGVVVYM